MNRLFIIKSISALVVALALMSCDDEGLDVLDIEVPEGYALSAGTSTIFMNSSKAYDSEAEWVTSIGIAYIGWFISR